jgi:hypothetical protein
MKKQRTFQAGAILFLPVLLLITLGSMLNPQKGIVPTTISDFFLPGSQPLESGTFSDPDVCDNCHGGYDLNVEPAFNWRGSMMAHAQRDPLYLACLAISNQDAPEVGDLCIRCHTPKGWLEGRSVPTDGSALLAGDRESVQCHFCHRMIAPTTVGINPYPDDPLYNIGPGTNPSTYSLDQIYLSSLPFIPGANGNGMYVCDDIDRRRGPYYDPQANHEVPYSPFHPDAALCGTCHDVSNPVYEAVKDAGGNYLGYVPGDFDQPASDFSPYSMFPIERTYSEWLVSEYNTPLGVDSSWFGGNKPFVSTCQDCHMKDVTGKGCNKSYAPIRNDLPLHDLTGGNTFIPALLESLYPAEVNTVALMSGIARAQDMLQHASTMNLTVVQMSKEVMVKITNETGHKLPSGYPEGRRIWINIKAFNSITSETYESGHYDYTTGILNKTGAKIYEIKPGFTPALSALTGIPAGPTFHFVLNDTIYSDNRIPPRGFTNAKFDSIQSPPVNYAYSDGQYWDETFYTLPFVPDSVDVTLYYQTTSKEYIEFLRDENTTNDAGQVMYSLWEANGKSAPEIMNHKTWSGPPVLLSATLDVKVFLEGPFNGAAMNTSINERHSIPLSQPYNVPPWNYSGSEVVFEIPDTTVVDWVLMELRETTGDASTATSSTMIARKAVFLLNNGSVCDLDGFGPVEFEVAVTDNLFVVIWHRNHLGIISASPLILSSGIYHYDFTTGVNQVYGGITAHKEIAAGIWGMVAADGDANGLINSDDKNLSWMTYAGLSGYYSGDFNMDVDINNQDKNDLWIHNSDYSEQVPDAIPVMKYYCSVPH